MSDTSTRLKINIAKNKCYFVTGNKTLEVNCFTFTHCHRLLTIPGAEFTNDLMQKSELFRNFHVVSMRADASGYKFPGFDSRES